MEKFNEIKKIKGYRVDWIYPNSWNINGMDDKTFNNLVESIRETKGEYLKYKPIKIRKIREMYYEIIDGEKRWEACNELGYSHIPAIVEDVDIETAKVLNVILNRPERINLDEIKILNKTIKTLMIKVEKRLTK